MSSSTWFSKQLLTWHAKAGRHDLPWKKPLHPYQVWVSEIMLQQTQVTTVIPYFERFMQTFPTLESLAQAPLDQVLQHWSGLGYYARARNLHQSAKKIVEDHQGHFPRTLEDLIRLPGIALSTAGAILSQAFGIRAPILDGNVKRVLCRFHAVEGWPGQKEVENKLWMLAEKYTPSSKKVADYTQAIMDLGALCCTRSQPQCEQCPLAQQCLAFQNQTQLDFPTPKPKKALPTRHAIMLFIFNTKGEILLQQRPLKGIWAGLWSVPEFQDKASAQRFLKEGLRVKKITPLPLLKHSFTHFHLVISPQQIIAEHGLPHAFPFHWVSPKALTQKGLPAPIQKLIRRHPYEHTPTSRSILSKTTKKRARTQPPPLSRRPRATHL